MTAHPHVQPAPRAVHLAAVALVALLAPACVRSSAPLAPPQAVTPTLPAIAAATATGPIERALGEGVMLRVSVTPTGDQTELIEGQDVRLRLALTDPETDEPLRNARPIAWLDRRYDAEPTSLDVCRQKVGMYLQGQMFSRSVKARADVDLNSFFVITLTNTNHIAVLNPLMGFSSTQMYTTVPLDAVGEDWVLSPDERWLYVTMPAANRVAVVSTESWRVVERIELPPRPMRIIAEPGNVRLWVTHDEGGVSVIDRATRQLLGHIPTGAGRQSLAFADELVFASSEQAGGVTAIDRARLHQVADVATGRRPLDLSWSPVDGAVYVIHPDGSVAVVDAQRLEVTRRIQLDAGLFAIRFAPVPGPAHAGHAAPADEHAGHSAHATPNVSDGRPIVTGHDHGGSGGVSGSERFGFVTNPLTNRVYVLDAVSGEVVRSDSIGVGPGEIAFTQSFAYIRSGGSSEVSLIPLNDPTYGGRGTYFSFPAGEQPLASLGSAATVVSSPDMADAVFVVNEKERKVFYYHYMASMSMPMLTGSLTTFAFEPRAVLSVRKGLREEAPGIFEATIKLPEAGAYDVVFLLDEPRRMECIGGIAAQPDPARANVALAVKAEPVDGQELKAGENVLRVRLTDQLSHRPVTGVDDATVMVVPVGGEPVRAQGRELETGIYEFRFEVPGASVYYVTFELPGVNVPQREQPALVFMGRSR